MHETTVTLVLCSRNGKRTIGKCLDHIRSMDEAEAIEVVLVDNGSADGSLTMMQEFCRANPNLWRVIQEPKPGNSAGRNAGVDGSRGEVILFIDDDCYPEREFAAAWREIFERDPKLGFGSGRIMPYDEGQSTLGCNMSTTPTAVPPSTFVRRGFVQGSNMAFRRQALVDAGMFDDRFGAGTPFAGEEWEVSIRASYAGWAGGYFPEPSVAHDHGRFDGEAFIRGHYYDVGAGAVYAKHLLTAHAPATVVEIARDVRRQIRKRSAVGPLIGGAVQYYSSVLHRALS
jgi:glycosyltransferase involved in cell wall biosynthesis